MSILPRPVSPRSAFGDLWGYLSRRHPHRWPFLGLSAAITWVIIWAFVIDANTNTMPRQNQITYFKSWDADRTDAAVIMQQKLDLAEHEMRLRAKQKEMRKIADDFGIPWEEEAKRNDARRAEALKYWNAELDRRLAKAEAAEGPGAAGQDGKVHPVETLPAPDGKK